MSTRIRILLALLTGIGALVTPTAATAGSPVAAHRSSPGRHAPPGYLGLTPRATTPSAGPLTFAALGFGSALVGSAPVGIGPSALALNSATHTIYVANGANPNGSNRGGNTVSVIDARRCNARAISQCKGPWPTITVGNEPAGVGVDERTDTVYVSNIDDGTVSVINGATCNAVDLSGCGQTPATVPVGPGPSAVMADPANHTVYVAHPGSTGDQQTLSMLDSATCNAADLAACPTQPPPAITLDASPTSVDVDQRTHTVYVTVFGAVNGFAAFDANSCNATTQAGCGSIGYLPGDPIGPNAAAVDTTHATLYTANYDNTVSVYDLHRCNAGDLSDCATDTPGTVTPFPWNGIEHDLAVAVDKANHSVYVVYQKDDALLVIDADRCNGAHLTACSTLNPHEIHTGADPEAILLDARTQTLYAVNQVDNNLSVIDATRCNAQTTSGCRHPAPEIALPDARGMAIDVPQHTAYVASGASSVSMINTEACNALNHAECAQAPATTTAGDFPFAVAIDPETHAVYVANLGSGPTGSLSLLDDRTCNANHHRGCTTVATLQVPRGNPVDIAVNSRTDTIYVATITSDGGPNLISVYDGASCDPQNTSGCNQIPATVPTGPDGDGQSANSVAVNPQTNTIYATSDVTIPGTPFLGNTVFVINGATCDAQNMNGCAQPAATVDVGPSTPPGAVNANPFGIAVDPATDTIYTANIADGEHSGTVSVINGAICNGQNTTGCSQIPATAPAGFGAHEVTIDPATHKVYATNGEDTSVTVINGNTCNGTNARGCRHSRTLAILGDYPNSTVIDPPHGTAYVSDIRGVSIIPLIR